MKLKTLLHWRPGRLARNSSGVFAWMLLRAGTQAATILILARTLGATDYGRYVTVLAVASFLVPFAGLGLGSVLLRNGARDPAHIDIYLARALHGWMLSLPFCLAAAWALSELLLPDGIPRLAALSAIAAEVVATSLTELRARHLQAQHRMDGYGAINAGLAVLRLAAIGALMLHTSHPGPDQVLWAYAASSTAYAVLLLSSLTSGDRNASAPEPMALSTGAPFCLAGISMRLQAEFNKPLLAHISFDLAGTYNAGQRAGEMAMMPLLAMQEALWPRLYAQQNPMRQLRRTGLVLLLIAFALGAGMWLAAPALPYVLGESFSGAVDVLRMLAWLPLLQVFRALLNFHVIHQARMKLIGWAYAVGALVGVATVTMFVPLYGMNGAVLACYLSEVAMITYLIIGTMRPIR